MQAVQTLTYGSQQNTHRKPPTRIWLALTVALVIHALLLLAPGLEPLERPAKPASEIEIKIQYEEPLPVIEVPPETVLEAAIQQAIEEQFEERKNTSPALPPTEAKKVAEQVPEATIGEPRLTVPAPTQASAEQQTEAQRQAISRTILGRQFITEPSVTEHIFGPDIAEASVSPDKSFHFPVKPNMIALLDRPIVDLPFDYTPNLVHFAYDPGVKGDLQRFWDNITPEFGWRTDYGTEVKCVWVLVIAACGWGRSK